MINNPGQKKILILIIILISLSAPLFAHRISISGWVEGDRVYVEGSFSGGTRPIDSIIQVFDKEGNILHEGRTDQNGEYNFKIPETTTLEVLINAGAGHQARCTISEEEIRAEAEMISTAETVSFGTGGGLSISEEALRNIVATEVNKQLKHFAKQMAAAEAESAEPSFTDIAGGIGYILGLIGLGTYINYRRKSKEK